MPHAAQHQGVVYLAHFFIKAITPLFPFIPVYAACCPTPRGGVFGPFLHQSNYTTVSLHTCLCRMLPNTKGWCIWPISSSKQLHHCFPSYLSMPHAAQHQGVVYLAHF